VQHILTEVIIISDCRFSYQWTVLTIPTFVPVHYTSAPSTQQQNIERTC